MREDKLVLTMQVLIMDDGHFHLLASHHSAGEGQLQEHAELTKGFLLLELPHVDQFPDLLLQQRGVMLSETPRSQITIVSARNAVHNPVQCVVLNMHCNFMQTREHLSLQV